MRITYGLLNSQAFNDALVCLDSIAMPVKHVIIFNKIHKAIDREMVLAKEIYMKLLDKHVEKDETGRPVIKGKNVVYRDFVSYQKDMEEFLATEFELNCRGLDYNFIEGINLTPAHFRAIIPIMEGYKDD